MTAERRAADMLAGWLVAHIVAVYEEINVPDTPESADKLASILLDRVGPPPVGNLGVKLADSLLARLGAEPADVFDVYKELR